VTPTQDKPATAPPPPYPCAPPDEDEINLLDLWRVIWKRRKIIAWLVIAIVILTVVVSLLMTNMYKAEAVIMPVTTKDSGEAASVRP
jgi:LPS O-antigen subunit length determinant protein (WzzB/FepE family)